MNKKRVVITGLGVLSPVGSGVDAFWKGLVEGHSGIDKITHFDCSLFDCKIAGMLKNYDPNQHFNTKEVRHVSDFIQYAVVSAREAVKNAKLDLNSVNKERFGVVIGSGIGSLHCLETEHSRLKERGPSRISPFFIPKMIINEAAGQVSIEMGAHGLSTCVTTACATATNAIGDAMRFIQFGDADIIIAGGTEAANTELGVGGFCALKALSTKRNDDPTKASRPFDGDRDGFVMGEGAGVVVLESLEHAKKRGAPILAELVGYGRTCDAYHITAPEPTGAGAARAMKIAMDEGNIKQNEVSYINAHGTSTELNDKVETLAIKLALGDYAKKTPVSSTKSMTGHLLGAAGGVEFAACVLSIRDNIIPPTINYENHDPNCDLDYVPNQARKLNVNAVLTNSLGFGGHNATLALKKFKE